MWILVYVIDNIVGTFFSQNLQNSWKKNYKQSLETICDNLNKNLAVKVCSVSLDLNTNLTDSEKLDKVEELLCQQELVISKAQGKTLVLLFFCT